LRLWYIAAPPVLVESGGVGSVVTFDGVAGWEEYVIIDCLIKAAFKQETDPSLLIKQKTDLIKRIGDSLLRSDGCEPDRIRDVSSEAYDFDPWG
jgi:hypothetical protein